MSVTLRRRCVLIFDCDGTLRAKDHRARVALLSELLEAGFILAVCSGNTADHVIQHCIYDLFLNLARAGNAMLLKQVYVFFQLGGALARFDGERFRKVAGLGPEQLVDELLPQQSENYELGSEDAPEKRRRFAPAYIDSAFVDICDIELEKHNDKLGEIWEEAREQYYQWREEEKENYKLDDNFGDPEPQKRPVSYQRDGKVVSVHVQWTIKPILSEHHLRNKTPDATETSLRTRLAQLFDRKLSEAGLPLGAFVGGRTSIDIAYRDQSKKKALVYLLSLLHLTHEQALYFGDELHSGGNDVNVPIELGITSFSVGEQSAIFHPKVFAAPKRGPMGTECILHKLLADVHMPGHCGAESLVESFLRRYFAEALQQKIREVSPATLQLMTLIATAEARGMPTANVIAVLSKSVENSLSGYPVALGSRLDD